jgi:hypothetical protein
VQVLYRDTRGDFHMLFHYFGLKEDHGDHGGHAHASSSGLEWEFTVGHSWTLQAEFTAPAVDGTNAGLGDRASGLGAAQGSELAPAPASFGYRQRPHVVLSPDTGEITHLLTGVVFDSNRP